jgi:hypothetical protein
VKAVALVFDFLPPILKLVYRVKQIFRACRNGVTVERQTDSAVTDHEIPMKNHFRKAQKEKYS